MYQKIKNLLWEYKKSLTPSSETTLLVSNFYNGKDIFERITRRLFEEICEDLFKRLNRPLVEALQQAYLNIQEISEIVLVGGYSRIPIIKIFLEKYFNIPKITRINDSINPEQTIAYRAKIMAAKILNKNEKSLADFYLLDDITPLSLGINVLNKSNIPEIKKRRRYNECNYKKTK